MPWMVGHTTGGCRLWNEGRQVCVEWNVSFQEELQNYIVVNGIVQNKNKGILVEHLHMNVHQEKISTVKTKNLEKRFSMKKNCEHSCKKI